MWTSYKRATEMEIRVKHGSCVDWCALLTLASATSALFKCECDVVVMFFPSPDSTANYRYMYYIIHIAYYTILSVIVYIKYVIIKEYMS